MSKIVDADFLNDYEKEADWAAGHGVSQRTAARYRQLGLPYLTFGGFVWIPKQAGREWIAGRVKRRKARTKAVSLSMVIARQSGG